MSPMPEWARWQADNAPPGYPRRLMRLFWRQIAWEVRMWLALTVVIVVMGLAFLVWAVVHAL